MNKLLLFFHFTLVVLALSLNAQGSIVTWPSAGLSTWPWGSYTIYSFLAEEYAGGAGVDFEVQDNGTLSLTATSVTVAVGHLWYETAYGAPVDANAVSVATPFADNIIPTRGTVNIDINQIFFLGFWLDADAGGAPSDIYGWASLLWDGTELTLVDSAAETTGVGIYAGTYDAIPEPSAAGLLLVGIAAALLRRRRPHSSLRSGDGG